MLLTKVSDEKEWMAWTKKHLKENSWRAQWLLKAWAENLGVNIKAAKKKKVLIEMIAKHYKEEEQERQKEM